MKLTRCEPCPEAKQRVLDELKGLLYWGFAIVAAGTFMILGSLML